MSTDKKTDIINHAIELFAEKGYEGTSIRDLAAKAEMNVAMVNYYFGSKEKLFEAIVEHKSSYMKDRIDELNSNEKLTELDKIDAIIGDYVHRLLTQCKFHKVLHQELLKNKMEAVNKDITKNFARNTKNISLIIQKGIDKGIFNKNVDPILTVVTIVGTISQVVLNKDLCNNLLERDGDNDPYKDEAFHQRLTSHIKTMVHAYLLKKQ